MEPIPETRRAIDELDVFTDEALLDDLQAMSRRVQALVPSCRGMSVALLDQGVTLTLVASQEEIAVLDAVQYLDGGPCVNSTEGHAIVVSDNDELDEQGWHLFAAATAADGIRSTLSLPIVEDGAVTGSVNLYAAEPHAFDGQHEAISSLLGAWAGGAVINADLTFSTRQAAQRAPQLLADTARVETAVGVLVARWGHTEDEARRHLEDAAAAAGIPVVAIASTVLTHFNMPEE